MAIKESNIKVSFKKIYNYSSLLSALTGKAVFSLDNTGAAILFATDCGDSWLASKGIAPL